jgi:hypothetical protein
LFLSFQERKKKEMSRREKRNVVHLNNGLARLAVRMGVPGAVCKRTRTQDLRPEFSLGGTRVVVSKKGRMFLFTATGSIATTASVRECITLVEKAINCGL